MFALMARVKHNHRYRLPGYQLGEKNTEDSVKAGKLADRMLRLGKRNFTYKGILYVMCGGRFMPWDVAEARGIGR